MYYIIFFNPSGIDSGDCNPESGNDDNDIGNDSDVKAEEPGNDLRIEAGEGDAPDNELI
eukprot:Pgem_evm1s5260